MDNQIVLTGDTGCSSFELKRTSKGYYSWGIKVYNTDIQKSYDIARDIDQQAIKDYGNTISDKEED